MNLGARVRIELQESKRLLDKVAVSARKVLMQQGAYIRKTAQNSMKVSDYPSRPGRPPRRITGLLSDWIIFKWDASPASVVVGPQLLAGSLKKNPTIPEILEGGGSEVALVIPGKDYKIRQRRRVTIASRPYMEPALERSQAQLPKLWANSLTS